MATSTPTKRPAAKPATRNEDEEGLGGTAKAATAAKPKAAATAKNVAAAKPKSAATAKAATAPKPKSSGDCKAPVKAAPTTKAAAPKAAAPKAAAKTAAPKAGAPRKSAATGKNGAGDDAAASAAVAASYARGREEGFITHDQILGAIPEPEAHMAAVEELYAAAEESGRRGARRAEPRRR